MKHQARKKSSFFLVLSLISMMLYSSCAQEVIQRTAFGKRPRNTSRKYFNGIKKKVALLYFFNESPYGGEDLGVTDQDESQLPPGGIGSDGFVSYWPQRRLQDAIFGSVWACLVLRKHYGVAADDAARAAGVEPGDPQAPIVWEITGDHVAIKMIELLDKL